MFSGIIENSGKVQAIKLSEQGAKLFLNSSQTFSDFKIGESIAIDGVCLTLLSFKQNLLEFDVASETLRRTSLGQLREGQTVNMERSLQLGDRICGHFVFGHVDTLAKLVERSSQGETLKLSFACEQQYLKMLAPKGSVSISGVSLTIGEVWQDGFSIYLIPHSAAQTTLGSLNIGASLNLEVDMLARYVANFLTTGNYVRAAA